MGMIEHLVLELSPAENSQQAFQAPHAAGGGEEKDHLGDEHVVVLALFALVRFVHGYIFELDARQGQVV